MGVGLGVEAEGTYTVMKWLVMAVVGSVCGLRRGQLSVGLV